MTTILFGIISWNLALFKVSITDFPPTELLSECLVLCMVPGSESGRIHCERQKHILKGVVPMTSIREN